MLKRYNSKRAGKRDAGSVLFMTAVIMVGLLGVSAFAIDLVSFYLARAEAQRAADAAALAGATVFVNTGCTTTTTAGCAAEEASATQQAQYVGDQNTIGGQAVNIQSSDVTYNFPSPTEPQITVVVKRSMPTFFAKIFGIQTTNVGATATAEAYNPSGGTTPVGVTCLKPFLVPNCDPSHTSPVNATCTSGTAGPFFDTSTGDIKHPGTYPSGVIGEPWKLHSNAAPSQWYLVGFNGAPPSSGSALRNHIAECTPLVLSCGATLTTANGKKVGPVGQGVDALINSNGNGLNQGQDSICAPTTSPACATPPFPITGGNNNLNSSLIGKTFFGSSPSIVTLPVYDGHALSPGGDTVTIVGYLQVFMQDVDHQGSSDNVDVIILNVSSCSGSTGSTSSAVVAPGGSPIPIRLIRTS